MSARFGMIILTDGCARDWNERLCKGNPQEVKGLLGLTIWGRSINGMIVINVYLMRRVTRKSFSLTKQMQYKSAYGSMT
jgi:hypothetical protein